MYNRYENERVCKIIIFLLFDCEKNVCPYSKLLSAVIKQQQLSKNNMSKTLSSSELCMSL